MFEPRPGHSTARKTKVMGRKPRQRQILALFRFFFKRGVERSFVKYMYKCIIYYIYNIYTYIYIYIFIVSHDGTINKYVYMYTYKYTVEQMSVSRLYTTK